ncbi:hypothetical protein SISNIDRAFT_481043 [Sistotremastrum niveocremeum HHB9708]|uniref:Uncharacterized protein n=1 Tax=Sistotremastrum niveocremeum HHB9708 TaxID=1314777 RepID=A0A164ZZM7_9AGAM|nr:hypothetical protein SISNIDRAFT_481043 [Sistotremastrum niveocremeum HHB9708]
MAPTTVHSTRLLIISHFNEKLDDSGTTTLDQPTMSAAPMMTITTCTPPTMIPDNSNLSNYNSGNQALVHESSTSNMSEPLIFLLGVAVGGVTVVLGGLIGMWVVRCWNRRLPRGPSFRVFRVLRTTPSPPGPTGQNQSSVSIPPSSSSFANRPLDSSNTRTALMTATTSTPSPLNPKVTSPLIPQDAQTNTSVVVPVKRKDDSRLMKRLKRPNSEPSFPQCHRPPIVCCPRELSQKSVAPAPLPQTMSLARSISSAFTSEESGTELSRSLPDIPLDTSPDISTPSLIDEADCSLEDDGDSQSLSSVAPSLQSVEGSLLQHESASGIALSTTNSSRFFTEFKHIVTVEESNSNDSAEERNRISLSFPSPPAFIPVRAKERNSIADGRLDLRRTSLMVPGTMPSALSIQLPNQIHPLLVDESLPPSIIISLPTDSSLPYWKTESDWDLNEAYDHKKSKPRSPELDAAFPSKLPILARSRSPPAHPSFVSAQ